MMQMIAENKSLWRIKNNYKADSDCSNCRDFWKKLEKEKEKDIMERNEMMKSHMSQKDIAA
jgi:hypothetical protein